MQDILAESIRILKRGRARRKRMIAILLVLSLLVSLDVFWILRKPGLTLAGDADCRITEHTHDELCYSEEAPCALPEHVHTIACYADETADVETQLDWQKMFADYPYTDNLQQDLVGIAKTQVGYRESTENFQVDDSGIRHGYTRYGAWYGAPYGNWSAMFVSFCLHYAGANPEEFPGNTGADSMARLWEARGNYTAAGSYSPSPGDLVFFTDNTVGIVAELQSTTVYVIRGDQDGAVTGSLMTLTDATISGWGLTASAAEAPGLTEPTMEEPITEEPTTEESTPTEDPLETTPVPTSSPIIFTEEMLDISNGPVFYIFTNCDSPRQTRLRTFSLGGTRTTADLLTYLRQNGGNHFFTLLDMENHELPKDADGNYLAEAYKGYKLTVSFSSPNGFHPGIYQYQVPNGLMVDGGNGSFILSDGTNVGTWTVTESGLITINFNDNINDRTEVTVSATLGMYFNEQQEPIKFDGLITVIVQSPTVEVHPTTVQKWGVQGDPNEGQDPTKLYWTVRIDGHEDSHIPGSTLADQVLKESWSYEHHYTASDMAAGIYFGVEIPPEAGIQSTWCSWTVTTADPNLVWTENGWTYRMPESIVCESCHQRLVLGNNNWSYYVKYTSTPDVTNVAGGLPYANRVESDHQHADGWAEFTQNNIHAGVHKEGRFVSDATGGQFLWEIQVTLPGRKPDERAVANWTIQDTMTIVLPDGTLIDKAVNDLNHATVTANYRGQTITVPRIQDATAEDPYCWYLYWSTGGTDDSNHNTRAIYLLCQCKCTPETCGLPNANCWYHSYTSNEGQWVTGQYFCPCWTETEDTTFTISYTTEDAASIEAYGGMNHLLRNVVLLSYDGSAVIADTAELVPIPAIIGKELHHSFDGHTANYIITVNESKLVLTDGSPLVIHDVMTDTLAFMRGTLEVFTEDEFGRVARLVENTDFTVTYDGSGTQTDENGKKVHVLDVTILHPQPVKYILDYDATLIMPDKVTEGIKYQNSASVSLWGHKITDSTTEKVYADLNISARQYAVEIYKVDGGTGTPLAGATFGLFNDKYGGLIASATTDASGTLLFKTNVEDGIILREHELYYLQELRAPPGYQLDDTKHWFRFCNESGDTCSIYHDTPADTNIIRIPLGQNGHITVKNHLLHYDLPATGGSGVYPLLLVSVIFVITPLVYMSIRRRKRERRGVG